MKFRITLIAIILILSIALAPVMYFVFNQSFTNEQLKALLVLAIICSSSALYCFIVGEISNNNSQMDKLWSILPPVYTWVVTIMDAFNNGAISIRLLIMAILSTLWGIRLTFNFARKGAYSWKFWSGKEDYRWVYLRSQKGFKPHYKWLFFNLFFISIYQNVLILLTTFPALISMGSTHAFGVWDIVAASLASGFLVYETIADEQQWKFQTKKWQLINSGLNLADLPKPYNKGFNTIGLWSISRHPNYFAEQAFWVSFFIFSIGALNTFNWTFIGSLLLVVLFMGSSTFQEMISQTKYPEYAYYCKHVSRYFPFKKYKEPIEN